MGKPAARLTDMTAHGGTIVGPGCPTVLIGKMPAACLGDQHVCPMVTPAPAPIPHVGGPMLLGSMGVFIGKKPAGRLGDVMMCVGPPSQPVMGCFTVMIGEAGSGSQAGSAGAAAAASIKSPKGPKKVEAIPVKEQKESPKENHEIKGFIKDKAGRPLAGLRYKIEDPDKKVIRGATTSDGMVLHGGYDKQGSFKVEIAGIANAKWSKSEFKVDEELTLSAAADVEDGKEVTFFVSAVLGGGGRVNYPELKTKAQGKKAEVKWKLTSEDVEALCNNDEMHVEGAEFMAFCEGGLAVSPVAKVSGDIDLELEMELTG